MGLVADRVLETSATTGTGTFSLAGAVVGHRSFAAAFADTNVVSYCIEDGVNWEVGEGTYDAGTLARTTVQKSSNGNAHVDFPTGTKRVFNTYTAENLAPTGPSLPTGGTTGQALVKLSNTDGDAGWGTVASGGGGGGSGVLTLTQTATGAALTSSSGTPTQIGSLSLSIPASVGNLIECEFNCAAYTSNDLAVKFSINGVDDSRYTYDKVTNNHAFTHRIVHSVVSGDISGGVVTIVPKGFTSGSGTATWTTDGLLFTVKNLGAAGSSGGGGGGGASTPHALSVHLAGTCTTGSTPSKITFDTVDFDTDSAFASSRFTAQYAGYYQVNANACFLGTSGSNEGLLYLYKNGTQYRQGGRVTNGAQVRTNTSLSSLIYLAVGDYVEIWSYSSTAPTIEGTYGQTWFTCSLESGGAASGSGTGTPHAFRAQSGGTQSISSGAFVKVAFPTKTFDTDGAFDVSTNRFTATVAGYYQIGGEVNAGSPVARLLLGIFKNGVQISTGPDSAGASNYRTTVNDLVHLAVGDYLELWAYSSGTSIDGGASDVYFFGFLVTSSTSAGLTPATVTWNPSDRDSSISLSGGNLTASKSGSAGNASVRATNSIPGTGKGYFEVHVNQTTYGQIGLAKAAHSLTTYAGGDATGWGYDAFGGLYNNAASVGMIATYTNGDTIGIAFNNGSVWFSKNGTFSGDPVAGTGAAFTGVTGPIFPCVSVQAVSPQDVVVAAFTTTTFAHAPPTGYPDWATAAVTVAPTASALKNFSVYLSSVQSVGAGFVTANFDTVEFDDDSIYNTTTFKATPPAGKWLFGAHVQAAGSFPAQIRILKNTTPIAEGEYNNGDSTNTKVSVTRLVVCNGTDTISVQGYGPGARDYIAGIAATYFWGTQVA